MLQSLARISFTSASIAPCLPTVKNIAVREYAVNTSIYFPSDNQARYTLTPCNDELQEYEIAKDGTVDPSLAGDFAVDPSGLTILKATITPEDPDPISTAGLYYAHCDALSKSYGFKVLVVQQGPTCPCSQGSSSSTVDLSCNVIYADSTYDPIPAVMTWYRNGVLYKTDTPERTSYDAYTYISTSTITVSDAASNEYKCVQTFGETTIRQSGDIATNAPEFNDSCTPTYCGTAAQVQMVPVVPAAEDPPPAVSAQSQPVASSTTRDSALTTLEIVLVVVFGSLLLVGLVLLAWCCGCCSGGKRLRPYHWNNRENDDSYGAWDNSFDGRQRLQAPMNRSWMSSSNSINSQQTPYDFRFPQGDPDLKLRYTLPWV